MHATRERTSKEEVCSLVLALCLHVQRIQQLWLLHESLPSKQRRTRRKDKGEVPAVRYIGLQVYHPDNVGGSRRVLEIDGNFIDHGTCSGLIQCIDKEG
jgi:hypothetical protein